MKRSAIRVFEWVIFGALSLGFLAAMLFPIFARSTVNVRKIVLSSHSYFAAPRPYSQSKVPRGKRDLPLLMISWFRKENLRAGGCRAIFPDGTTMRRHYTVGETMSGGDLRPDTVLLQKVRLMPALPNGLADFESIPQGRLLIVSQTRAGRWITRYYDRQDLPPSVQGIANLMSVD